VEKKIFVVRGLWAFNGALKISWPTIAATVSLEDWGVHLLRESFISNLLPELIEQTEFFGPQLKKVIGNSSGFRVHVGECERHSDALLQNQVRHLRQLEQAGGRKQDPLVRAHGNLGGAGGGHVQADRSTEAALQLLLPFKEITLKEIKSRQSISEVVSGKLRDQCSPPLPVRHSMFPAYRCGDVVGCLLVH